MSQLSLYLDEKMMFDLQKEAKAARTSLSQYVRRLLRAHFAGGWPEDFLQTLGSVGDETFVAPADGDFATDAQREKL